MESELSCWPWQITAEKRSFDVSLSLKHFHHPASAYFTFEGHRELSSDGVCLLKNP